MSRPEAICRSHARLALLSACVLLVVCLDLGCQGSDKSANSDGVIRVTGIPDENPTAISRHFQPLVERLEGTLGRKVEYVPVTDYGAAVQALAAGKVDFAWLGGFTYVQAREQAEVTPLVMRVIDREFRTVIISNRASGAQSPRDLAGKRFAFGSKSSTSGHLMPRYFLAKEFGLDADEDFAGTPVYTGAHDATVKIVESGRVEAGAVNALVYERMKEEGAFDSDKVVLLWTTPPFSDYVWVARSELSPKLRDDFSQSFLSLRQDEQGDRVVLEALGASSYLRAKERDFDVIAEVARKVGLLKP